MCVDPGGGRKEGEFAVSQFEHFLLSCFARFPALHRFPAPTLVLASGSRERVGDWGSRPGRHLGTVDKQNISSGSGRIPGCTQEGACLSPRAQRLLPGTGQLHFECRVKPGREIPNQKAGDKVGNGAGVMRGPLCGKNGAW